MLIKRGIAVSPGVAIAPAIVLDAADQPIRRRNVPHSGVNHEIKRLENALAQSTAEIESIRDRTTESLGAELSKIFSVHIGMLADPALTGRMRGMIKAERVTAEYSVYSVLRSMVGQFSQNDSNMVRKMASDVIDLERRVLKHLIGEAHTGLSELDHQAIVVAHDLTPSQTASLDKSKIKALVIDLGGRTSHTAILAHALGIPAIVGLENISSLVSTGDSLIVDGQRGTVVVEPDAAKLMEYRQEVRRMAAVEDTLVELRDKPAVTRDGTEIQLLANIEFPHEVEEAVAKGAVGVGLYRTEFLFLGADVAPTEEEQYAAYVEVIKSLKGKPLTLRTLDLGADKIHESVTGAAEYNERNPFLGCRSIRLCLQSLPMFKTQLRAVLRASVEGPVKIMFPLVSNVMELRQAKMILSDVKEDLEDQGEPFREDIPVGMMIEVPSAAIQATTFAREVDFFSIGTNDLIQYTVAVDRSNERIANLYSAANPAVISLVKEVIRAAQRGKIETSLCGEMASEPEYTMLLIGLGLRTFSITPPAIPEIKQIIRSVTVDQCRRVARKVSGFDSDREIISYLRGEVVKVIPDLLEGRSFGL